ncbi:MAG TPA: translation elongation factor Ts [Gammaproteobacteria bacterium]|nr:translation elongation factor Ts [Gammaproteobacteria bacterium]
MTEITAEMVRNLRERTGVGMMECKKALLAANGVVDDAIEALRKAGQASAVKKGSRIAAEGLIAAVAAADQKLALIAEINCETDFVAREDRFKKFAVDVAQCALQSNVQDVTALSEQTLSNGKSLDAVRLELVAQIGENIAVRRFKSVRAAGNGVVAVYLHGGGTAARIGSIVALDIADANLAKDIAMHIAAMRPEYLSESEVPAERLAKEKEIFMAQTSEANAGKPADIVEKIIAGRLSKFLKEITLLGQPFVKNPDQTVGALLSAAKAKVTDFVRYEVGEGIEKKTTDFVSEVMAQVKG